MTKLECMFRKLWKKFWEPILGFSGFQWIIAAIMAAIIWFIYFTPYITITPTGYHTDAVIVTESDANLRKQFCEKIGITTPSEEWPIWSVRPSNGKILDGYEISSSTYESILTTKLQSSTKNVRLVYTGDLSWNDIKGVSQRIADNQINTMVYLDFSAAVLGFSDWDQNIFFGRNKLVSIVLPDGLTTLKTSLFKDCGELKSVTLPDSLESLAEYTFCNCESLSSITIPPNVNSIGLSVFENSGLESITIPASVTTIGNSAFNNCSNLEFVTFSGTSSLTSIGSAAFAYCCISDIIIPASVTTIGSGAFANCESLQSADFEDTVNRMWKIGSTTHNFNGYVATQFPEMLVNASNEAQYQGTWTKVTE